MPADANRMALRFVEETVWGEVPSGPPKLTNLRFTGENLRQESGSTNSAEIRSDRQIPALIRTGLNAVGDINFELSYDAYDAFFLAMIGSAGWSSEVTVGPITTISITAPDTIDDSGSGFGSLVVGQWIEVRGFTDVNNNGFFKIATAAAGSITIEQQTLVTEAAGDSVTIVMGAQAVNGTNVDSFVFEKEYTDLSNEFVTIRGTMIEAFSLTLSPEGIVTGTFGFIGRDSASAAATVGDGSPTAAPTEEVLNAIDHVDGIGENFSDVSLTALTLNLGNNLRRRLEIGTLGASSVGTGTIEVTGTMEAFYATKTLLDKFLNFTTSTLSVRFEDTAGNSYIFDLPEVKYSAGQRNAEGINTDIMEELGFSAVMDPTELVTIRIAKFAA